MRAVSDLARDNCVGYALKLADIVPVSGLYRRLACNRVQKLIARRVRAHDIAAAQLIAYLLHGGFGIRDLHVVGQGADSVSVGTVWLYLKAEIG